MGWGSIPPRDSLTNFESFAMFVLTMISIVTTSYLFFPSISISQYAVSNLTEQQCLKLKEKLTFPKEETKGFLVSGSWEQQGKCIKVD